MLSMETVPFACMNWTLPLWPSSSAHLFERVTMGFRSSRPRKLWDPAGSMRRSIMRMNLPYPVARWRQRRWLFGFRDAAWERESNGSS